MSYNQTKPTQQDATTRFAPPNWQNRNGTVFAATDAGDFLAADLLELKTYARPVSDDDCLLEIEMLADIWANQPIIILATTDSQANAQATAQRLANQLDRPVSWSLPPDGATSTAKWLHQRIAAENLDIGDQAITARLGEEFGARLRYSATEYQPTAWKIPTPEPTPEEGENSTACPEVSILKTPMETSGQNTQPEGGNSTQEGGNPPKLPRYDGYRCSRPSGRLFLDRKKTGKARAGLLPCKCHSLKCPSCLDVWRNRWAIWLSWLMPQNGPWYQIGVTRSTWATFYKALRRQDKAAQYFAAEDDPGYLTVLVNVDVPGSTPVAPEELQATITSMVEDVRPVSTPVLSSKALKIPKDDVAETVEVPDEEGTGTIVRPRWEAVASMHKTDVQAICRAIKAVGLEPMQVGINPRPEVVFLEFDLPEDYSEGEQKALLQRIAQKAELGRRPRQIAADDDADAAVLEFLNS